MSEALRLADELDAYHTAPHHKQAAAELRRLHAENEALRADAQRLDSGVILLGDLDDMGDHIEVLHKDLNLRAAIDAARRKEYE